MYCPLGNHLLRGSGVFITNPRHIRFVNKFFVDFLPSEKVCAKCRQDIEIAYEYKIKRAIKMRAKNGSLISSSDDIYTKENSNKSSRNVQKGLPASQSASSTEDYNDDRPSTSAQATAARERKERLRRRKLPLNIQIDARLPHIQPVPKRRQFIHANPDIMDIYIRGMTGG